MRRHMAVASMHQREKADGGGIGRRLKVSGELLKLICEARESGGGEDLLGWKIYRFKWFNIHCVRA